MKVIFILKLYKMKRINPFSSEFPKIKKQREEEFLKNEWKHDYRSSQFFEEEGFQSCWWNAYFFEKNYVERYLSSCIIWDRYNNQLGLEIYNFEEDMEYLANLPDDCDMQNSVIDEYNEKLDREEYYNMMYCHFYLCRFLESH